jgi:predicted ATPase
LDRARAHSESYGEEYLAAEIERLEALLLQSDLAPGEVVEKYLAEAIATARRQEARLFELRAAASLARLWGKQGRLAEARDLLAPVYGWFTEGFDTADLKEAKSLLNELT